jgi:hypothetical protein
MDPDLFLTRLIYIDRAVPVHILRSVVINISQHRLLTATERDIISRHLCRFYPGSSASDQLEPIPLLCGLVEDKLLYLRDNNLKMPMCDLETLVLDIEALRQTLSRNEFRLISRHIHKHHQDISLKLLLLMLKYKGKYTSSKKYELENID